MWLFRKKNKSKFTEEGFLSSGMDRLSKECRRRYLEWFTLCEDLNRYCVQLSHNITIHDNSRQESLVAALFFRLLSIFESSVILAERCIFNETQILLRTCIENLFILRAIANDESMADRYYEQNYLEKLRNLRLIRRYRTEKLYQGLDLGKRIEELEDTVNKKGIKKLTVADWANKAGLNDFYATAYPVFSWTTHSSVIDIGHYISGKSDEVFEEVSWSPQLAEMDKLLLTGVECVVTGLRSINKLFSLGAENDIEEYSNRYHQLANTLSNQDKSIEPTSL